MKQIEEKQESDEEYVDTDGLEDIQVYIPETEKAKDKMKIAESKCHDAMRKVNTLESELSEQKETVEHYEESSKQQQDDIFVKGTEIAKLENEIENFRTPETEGEKRALQNLKNKVSYAKNEIVKMQKELNETEIKQEQAKNKYEEIKKELEETEKELEEAKAEFEEKQTGKN